MIDEARWLRPLSRSGASWWAAIGPATAASRASSASPSTIVPPLPGARVRLRASATAGAVMPSTLDVLVHDARIGEAALDDAPDVVAGRAVAVDEGPVQRATVTDLLQ